MRIGFTILPKDIETPAPWQINTNNTLQRHLASSNQ
jgi:hypothetical protein